MGMWGFELYQNDTALDVKDNFEKLFNDGKAVKDITDGLIEDYKNIMGDANEEPLFWFALADTQWSLGVLLPFVKEKALYWIDQDYVVFNNKTINVVDKQKWQKTLDDLREKICSPQLPQKKRVKRKVYKCQWRYGDVFAYRLESDLAKQSKGDFMVVIS